MIYLKITQKSKISPYVFISLFLISFTHHHGYLYSITIALALSVLATLAIPKKLPRILNFLNLLIILCLSLQAFTSLTQTSLIYTRYFSYLLPLIVLSVCYLLKGVLNFSSLTISLLTSVIAFTNIFPTHIFRDRIDIKNFFRYLPGELISNKRILCVYEYPSITDQYSRKRFGRNICDYKERELSVAVKKHEYDLLIYISSKNEIPDGFTRLFEMRGISVFKNTDSAISREEIYSRWLKRVQKLRE